MLDLWAHHHGVQIDYSRSGKPTDNCFIETFNGSLRDECLNVHMFESMEEADAKIEAWCSDYDESRPHQVLGDRTPVEFASGPRDSERSEGSQTAEIKICGWTRICRSAQSGQRLTS
jgi:putative transposase